MTIAQEVVAGIKERASALDDAKATAQRTAGQRVKQTCHCSQIENEEEEESWREGDQMAAEWDEEEKLEDILERRRMEGSSLQSDVMRKVPEQVVHERMSQGKGVKGFKEKKTVPGWSVEEMKEKPDIAVEEDAEDMRKWKGLSQSEMDQCWTSTRSKKAREMPSEVDVRR